MRSSCFARIRSIGLHLSPRSPAESTGLLSLVGVRQSPFHARPHLYSRAAAAAHTAARPSAPLLPPQSASDAGRLTVVLDMDETLLHSQLLPMPRSDEDPRSIDNHSDGNTPDNQKPVDFTFEIGTGPNDKELVRSTLRPGLREFLHALSTEFEPILFTSAMQIYAEPLLNKIDATSGPDATPSELHPLWRHRIYRPGTVDLGQFSYVKDVSRLGRDMRRVVLIDNSWAACVANPDNCIVVPDYLGAKDDAILEKVLQMLRDLKGFEDVRPALIQTFKFREEMAKAGMRLPK